MYKTYIISLINTGSDDHLKSAAEWFPQSMASCNQFQWPADIFSAVNGHNIDISIWKDHGLPNPKTSDNKEKKFIGDLPGAQGCFLSHYTLWNICILENQPIVVLEDDAIVIGPQTQIDLDFDLVKLHAPRNAGQSKLGHWASGAFAYWISPAGAKKLVEFSKHNGPILADKIIASSVLNWGYIDTPIVKLGKRVGSSTQPEKYPYKFY